jgi:hypothetical protein
MVEVAISFVMGVSEALSLTQKKKGVKGRPPLSRQHEYFPAWARKIKSGSLGLLPIRRPFSVCSQSAADDKATSGIYRDA